MKILATGDTFGATPHHDGEFDLFVHAGNFLPVGQGDQMLDIDEQIKFVESQLNPWIDSINAKRKIIIPGNTDYACAWKGEDFQYYMHGNLSINELYLLNKKLVYGMPFLCPSLFRYTTGVFVASSAKAFLKTVNDIPKETRILVTREPSSEKALNRKIKALPALDLHIFSHAKSKDTKISKNVFYSKERPFREFEISDDDRV